MRPGAIELTVIFFGPTSRASVFAQPITPGRTVFESARLSIGSRTELDSMLITRPRPLRSSCGRQRVVSRIAESSSSSTAGLDLVVGEADGRRARRPPLLFTRMSIPPKASSVRSTRRLRSAGFVTSPRTASAPTLSASRSSRSRLRANMATFAPSPARDSAIASPIPEEAPQTIAVRPFSPRSMPPPLICTRASPPGWGWKATRHPPSAYGPKVARVCAAVVPIACRFVNPSSHGL